MRTVFLAFLLMLTLFARPILAADDPRNILGYGNTVWGMTEDEVLAAEAPLAEKVENPSPNRKTGDITSVVIKELEIGGDRFTAHFIFDSKNRRLKEVMLEGPRGKFQIEMTFSFIEKLLTEKYGQPTFNNKRKNVSWKLPKTTIELLGIDMPVWRQVFVFYKPTVAGADASKNL